MIQSFARLAARTGVERIKRFHIGNIYRNSPNGGHPKILKVAVFDIITSDPTSGVSEAEAIALVSEIIDIFPGLNATTYDIHISHSKGDVLLSMLFLLTNKDFISVCQVAFSKLSEDQRRNVISIVDDNKTALPVKRTLLTKQGFARATLDDLEALLQIGKEQHPLPYSPFCH
jgi:translation initiation factor 2-alpha kinase 4